MDFSDIFAATSIIRFLFTQSRALRAMHWPCRYVVIMVLTTGEMPLESGVDVVAVEMDHFSL